MFCYSCRNYLPRQCVWIEYDDLLALLFGILDGIRCASRVSAIVDGDQDIAVVYEISVSDVKAAALVFISYLHNLVRPFEKLMVS